MSEETKTSKEAAPKKAVKVTMPSVKEMFEAGVQFGHETKRWNPKMAEFIYSSKQNIHIIDISKTEEKLKEAVDFLVDAASRGNVIFVGTKRQAADIVKNSAIESGSHFVDQRWAGGLLTNNKEVKKSFNKLLGLEKDFSEGVEGRTKYEVSVMRKEWAKLNRLYSGVKTLTGKPTAVIVIDAKYEKGAVKEANKMGIPVVGIIDTNTDPDQINYVIPANDDAISSIKLLLKTIVEAVKEGNGGKGIKHELNDFSKMEIKIVKKEEEDEKAEVVGESEEATPAEPRVKKVARSTKSSKKSSGKGILERVQEEKEKKAKK